MAKKEKPQAPLELDMQSIDEWLEHDLRAAGMLPVKQEHPVTPPPLEPPNLQHILGQLPPQLVPILHAITTLYAAQHNTNAKATAIHPSLTVKPSKRPIRTPKAATADEIALKRQRNTDAARRSRLRKTLKLEALEKRANELEKQNEQLRMQVQALEEERDAAAFREKRAREKVKELEDQLAKAHKMLLDDYIHKEDKNT